MQDMYVHSPGKDDPQMTVNYILPYEINDNDLKY